MGFDDIIGQQQIVKNLKNAINMDNIIHAYLFYGPEGVGINKTAGVFANAIICSSAEAKPCGECSNCIKFRAGSHPDIYIINSDKSSIGVDLIRKLNNDIQIKPYLSSKKVYLIYDFWKMTVQAQNALLKNLEEPPGHCVILMLTNNCNGLLPTIISRSQILKFQRLSSDEVQEILNRRFNKYDELQIEYAVRLSEGIPGKGIRYLESPDYISKRNSIIAVICKILVGTRLELINFIEELLVYKKEIDQVIDVFELWLRDIIVLKETGENKLLVNLDKHEMLCNQANMFTSKQINGIMYIVRRTKKLINTNANYKLVMEKMLVDILEVKDIDKSCGDSI